MRDAIDTLAVGWKTDPRACEPTMPSMRTTFAGFPRPGARAGVRNDVFIVSATGLTGPSARRIHAQVKGAKLVCSPWDTGPLGDDRETLQRALRGIVTHPNAGAVLIISANKNRATALAQDAAKHGRRVEALILDDCGHDALALSDRGVRLAAQLTMACSRDRREEVPAGDLFVGLECGRSDPSSGLFANPLLGAFADRLIDIGGTAVIGETTEWLGAEHLLEARATNPQVAARIGAAVRRREKMAVAAGIDLRGNNPGPTNIAAGLSTIEEKSLGNITKSGSHPILDVLDYAEAPPSSGLYLMDAPAYAPESLTGFTAAGAQLHLFTTGVGNSFVSALSPTLKVSANPHTVARLPEQIDIDATAALRGEQSTDELCDMAWDRVLDVAAGTLTWGEVLAEGEEVISRFGPAL